MSAPVFWWRLPDDEAALMALRPAELKVYLVIVRAIQRDRNQGKLSIRQIEERSGVGNRHVQAALAALLERGLLRCSVKPGATSVFHLPCTWRDSRISASGQVEERPEVEPNCIPTGIQFESDIPAHKKPNCIPTGAQNRIPTGIQHLEYSKKEILLSSSKQSSPPAIQESKTTTTATESPERRPTLDHNRVLRACEIRVQELQPFRERMRDLLGFKKLPPMLLTRYVIRTAGGSVAAVEFLEDTARDLETRRGMRPRQWKFFRVEVRAWAERQSADPLRRASSAPPTKRIVSDVRSPSEQPPALTPVTPRARSSWWSATELLEAREALAAHRRIALPDPQIAARVLQYFEGMEDFRLWFTELARRFPGSRVQSFGFYESDARNNWSGRRQELEAQKRAAAAKHEALNREVEIGKGAFEEEWQAYEHEQRAWCEAAELINAAASAQGWQRLYSDSDCKVCLGYGRNVLTRDSTSWTACECPAGSELTRQLEQQLEHCLLCDDAGLYQTQESLWKWCDCEHAKRQIERHPGWVDESNANIQKLRRRFQPATTNLAVV